jgi:hypothetical protein
LDRHAGDHRRRRNRGHGRQITVPTVIVSRNALSPVRLEKDLNNQLQL